MPERGASDNDQDLQALIGRRIERAELRHQEGDTYEVIFWLDDGSVARFEAWGNSPAHREYGLPPSTRFGIDIARASPEQVAEMNRQIESEERAQGERE